MRLPGDPDSTGTLMTSSPNPAATMLQGWDVALRQKSQPRVILFNLHERGGQGVAHGFNVKGFQCLFLRKTAKSPAN